MCTRPKNSAENTIAVFSPYLRVRLMSSLRNIHSSNSGPRITRNTTFHTSNCMARSLTELLALPPESSDASILPMRLPTYMSGKHMTSSLKNWPGFMSNLRVSMTDDLPMISTASGMATRYKGASDATYTAQFGRFVVCSA